MAGGAGLCEMFQTHRAGRRNGRGDCRMCRVQQMANAGVKSEQEGTRCGQGTDQNTPARRRPRSGCVLPGRATESNERLRTGVQTIKAADTSALIYHSVLRIHTARFTDFLAAKTRAASGFVNRPFIK